MLAVVRHGDRTPKQKMKMKVTQAPLLDLMHKYLDSKGKQAKLKVTFPGVIHQSMGFILFYFLSCSLWWLLDLTGAQPGLPRASRPS